MRISSKIFIGFILIIVFSILASSVDIKLSSEVHKNTDFLTNSEAIVRNSARLHKQIIEMQSAFRGYLLAGDEHFLVSYHEGIKEVPKLFKEEKKLLEGSTEQLLELDSIQFLHQQWVDYANQLISAKRVGISKPDGAIEYNRLIENKFRRQFGQKINDRISEKFKEFDRHEYGIRDQRRLVLEKSINDTRSTSFILNVIIAIIGVISAIYITRIISKRITSMVDLADRISKGEFKVIDDKKNDELTKLSQSLNIMSITLNKNFTELERQNKELDQFAYVVSHDLKAPLRGLYNLFAWMEEDLGKELSESIKKYHEMMKGRIHRLESLIVGLLEYARIGREEKKIEKVDIKNLLIGIVEAIVPKKFNVTIKDKIPQIVTERIRLEQVFSNLISNAVKFHNKEKGNIIIGCKDLGKYLEFSVTDDGIGIDSEYHDKIFIIFQTLRKKDEIESTGIGLTIVKKIVDEQKGEIRLISQKGKGTTFIFTWPKMPVEDMNHYLK
jgi:signal transduction histidine kinase